jgi:hypothetical protein
MRNGRRDGVEVAAALEHLFVLAGSVILFHDV